MKKQILLLCAVTAYSGHFFPPALADSGLPPHPIFTSSYNGSYVFKMIPARWSDGKKIADAFGVAYKVHDDGGLTEQWRTTGWFAWQTFLSDDGEYLVRMGPWNFGDKPDSNDLAIEFYKRDQSLKSYSTADLIEDDSHVRTSVTHYIWLAARPGLWLSSDNLFTLRTIDDIYYEFDATTGNVKKKTKNRNPHTQEDDTLAATNSVQFAYQLDEYHRLSVPPGFTRLRSSHGRPKGGDYDTYFTVYDVRTKALLATPDWIPTGNQTLPFTANEAAKIAETFWNCNYSAHGDFRIESITLRNKWIDHDPTLTRWFYEVDFEVGTNPLLVMLDGTPVPALVVDLKAQSTRKKEAP